MTTPIRVETRALLKRSVRRTSSRSSLQASLLPSGSGATIPYNRDQESFTLSLAHRDLPIPKCSEDRVKFKQSFLKKIFELTMQASSGIIFATDGFHETLELEDVSPSRLELPHQ